MNGMLSYAITLSMAQLLVRNVSEDLVQALKARAAAHGRSVEAEHRVILGDVLGAQRGERVADWMQGVKAFQASLGERIFEDSTAMLRELRDSR